MRSPSIASVIVLLFAALWMLAPVARADMVPTDEVAPQGQAKTEREKVEAFLERATVQEKLKVLGVKDTLLKSRVDALTDEEVRMLAARIDALPAGGLAGMSDFQLLMVILLVAILVAIIA